MFGWSKSSAGSWVIPIRSITARDRRLAGTVQDRISSRPRSSNPNASAARAASVA